MPPLDEDALVTPDEIRAYAAGDLGWAQLRDRGVTYYQVLAGLCHLGLRPPITDDRAQRRGASARHQAVAGALCRGG